MKLEAFQTFKSWYNFIVELIFKVLMNPKFVVGSSGRTGVVKSKHVKL